MISASVSVVAVRWHSILK